MTIDLFLQLVENVVPIGVVVLVGIGLFFMRDVYERQLVYMREREQSLKEFYDQRIRELMADISDLKQENKYLAEESREALSRETEAHLKLVNLIKDVPILHEGLKTLSMSLQDGVQTLTSDKINGNGQVVQQLQSEILELQLSIKNIEKVDERSRNWLQEIEELSVNRKQKANDAIQYAREQARRKNAYRVP